MKKLALFFILLPIFPLAQESDAQFWTGSAVKVRIIKNLSAYYETQLRFDQNISRFNQYYSELGTKYEVLDGLNLGLIYRYARKNSGDYFFNQNRFCVDASYGLDLFAGFSLKTRARYQHAFDRFKTVNNVLPDEKSVYRQSFKLSYRHSEFKLIQPYIGGEIFHALQPTNESAGFLDTYRLKTGFVIDLPKRFEIKAFYTFEKENRTIDNFNHIYGVQLNWEVKKKLIRKKKTESND